MVAAPVRSSHLYPALHGGLKFASIPGTNTEPDRRQAHRDESPSDQTSDNGPEFRTQSKIVGSSESWAPAKTVLFLRTVWNDALAAFVPH